jgi:hypothetical protein
MSEEDYHGLARIRDNQAVRNSHRIGLDFLRYEKCPSFTRRHFGKKAWIGQESEISRAGLF